MSERNGGIGKERIENASNCEGSLFFFHYLPRQNLEKMEERMSSVTLVPMIVPRSFRAERRSEVMNSAEIFCLRPWMTDLQEFIAFVRA